MTDVISKLKTALQGRYEVDREVGQGKAIEMYEKFIAAWEGGDEAVQPLVDRARAAVAGLRGEMRSPERP